MNWQVHFACTVICTYMQETLILQKRLPPNIWSSVLEIPKIQKADMMDIATLWSMEEPGTTIISVWKIRMHQADLWDFALDMLRMLRLKMLHFLIIWNLIFWNLAEWKMPRSQAVHSVAIIRIMWKVDRNVFRSTAVQMRAMFFRSTDLMMERPVKILWSMEMCSKMSLQGWERTVWCPEKHIKGSQLRIILSIM